MFDFCVCECISVVWISGIALPFFVNACLLLHFYVLLLVYVFIFVFCSVCLSGTVSRPTSRGSFVASRPVHCWPVARPTLFSFFFLMFLVFFLWLLLSVVVVVVFLSILFLLLLSLIHLASFGKCCWCYSCGCCYQCSLCQPSLKVVTTTTTGGSVLFPSQRTFLAPRTRTFGLFWPVLACLGYLSLIYALFGVLF